MLNLFCFVFSWCRNIELVLKCFLKPNFVSFISMEQNGDIGSQKLGHNFVVHDFFKFHFDMIFHIHTEETKL